MNLKACDYLILIHTKPQKPFRTSASMRFGRWNARNEAEINEAPSPRPKRLS